MNLEGCTMVTKYTRERERKFKENNAEIRNVSIERLIFVLFCI